MAAEEKDCLKEVESFDKNIESVNILRAMISKNKTEGRKERLTGKV